MLCRKNVNDELLQGHFYLKHVQQCDKNARVQFAAALSHIINILQRSLYKCIDIL